MATPLSGAITASDLRSEITRGSTDLSMNEIRTRLGISGAISFGQCYGAEGFIITCGSNSSIKFTNINGYAADYAGSVTPSEVNGRVQHTTNSFTAGLWENTYITGIDGYSTTRLVIAANSTSAGYSLTSNGDAVTTNYKATDITRWVVGNTSIPITAAQSNTSGSFLSCNSNSIPASGTLHCVVQF